MEDTNSAMSFPVRRTTLNLRGNLLQLDRPVVMGILNLTPDSFYKGSRVDIGEAAVKYVGQMLEEGASIIDVGAASSRPGSEVISIEEELQRLLPTLELLLNTFPNALFSIDTWRAEVAKRVLQSGVHMINDITGGESEPDIVGIVQKSGAAYVLMHMFGKPGHMRSAEREDIVSDILQFFARRIRELRMAGLTEIILDPGFGFGKSIDQNFQLLKKLEVFQFLGLPVLAGISRKSMIWKTLDIDPSEAGNGTTALHMLALQQGVAILRVHDVKEAMETIRLYEALKSA